MAWSTFSCAHLQYGYLLVKYLYKSFAQFFSMDYFLLLCFESSLYILDTFKIHFLLMTHKLSLLLCMLVNFLSTVGRHELYLGCCIPVNPLEFCSGMQLCYLRTVWHFEHLLLTFVRGTVSNLGLIFLPVPSQYLSEYSTWCFLDDKVFLLLLRGTQAGPSPEGAPEIVPLIP